MVAKYSYLTMFFLIYSCNHTPINLVPTAKASADASYPNYEVEKLCDGDLSTIWNAGSRGDHWVDFDLGKPSQISKISFTINTDTVADIDYFILVKPKTDKEYININSNNVIAHNSDSFSFQPSQKDITNVKILITNKHSWVSIRDVKILGTN